MQGAQQMRTPRALEGLERVCAMIADIGLIDVMWILDQHPRHPYPGACVREYEQPSGVVYQWL